MRKTHLLIFLFMGGLVACCFNLHLANADSAPPPAVYVNADGSISPLYAPIQKVGETYFLTENLSLPIVINCANAVFDGNGYTVLGGKNGAAVILQAENTVLKNTHIVNWDVGVLTIAKDSTIKGNIITFASQCIVLYGESSCVTGNFLGNSREAVHIEASNSIITQNQIQNNTFALILPSSTSKTLVTENNFENNLNAVCFAHEVPQVYKNNFVNNSCNAQLIYSDQSLSKETCFWDNDEDGNYWNTQINLTQQIVRDANPRIVDRHPLSVSVKVASVLLPSPTLLPSTLPIATPAGELLSERNSTEIYLSVILFGLFATALALYHKDSAPQPLSS
jgi:hypothetical protein